MNRLLLLVAASATLAAAPGVPARAEDLPSVPDIRLETIHWIPRTQPAHESPSVGATADGTTGGYLEFHGGFFDRENGVERSGVFGTRSICSLAIP